MMKTWLLKFIPYSIKQRAEHFLMKRLESSETPLRIRYLDYELELPPQDEGARQIFVRYRHLGEWWHEPLEQEVFVRVTSQLESVVLLDAGASYGMYTFLSLKQPSVRYRVAIEADQTTCRYLKENLSRNHALEKVHCLCAAIAEESGHAYEMSGHKNSEHRQVTVSSSFNLPESPVSISLDDLLMEVSPEENDVIFLKMDIEGAEVSALKGFQNFLNSGKPWVGMLECNVGLLDRIPGHAGEFARFLYREGHRVWKLHPEHRQFEAIPDLPSFEKVMEDCRKCSFPANLFNVLVTNLDEQRLDLQNG